MRNGDFDNVGHGPATQWCQDKMGHMPRGNLAPLAALVVIAGVSQMMTPGTHPFGRMQQQRPAITQGQTRMRQRPDGSFDLA